jgi:5-(carboxyamino)imidazole ribonucleotide mutase
MYKVAVIIGSDSDYPVMKPCLETLASFGITADLRVISAHRTPEAAHEFSVKARERGYGAIIAAAGKAAHLAGVMAASTTLPVIGVPVKSSTLDGLDSLLSTVQMPSGIPVATVAIDGAQNAALLAVQMFSISDASLAEKLAAYKKSLADGVIKKEAALLEKIKNEQ